MCVRLSLHSFCLSLRLSIFACSSTVSNRLFDVSDWNHYIVRSDPPPCRSCLLSRIESERLLLSSWDFGELNVRVMELGIPIPTNITGTSSQSPSIASSSSSSSSSIRSTIRPKRKATQKLTPSEETISHQFMIDTVNSQDSITRLKLIIYQYSDVPPSQQEIWSDGKRIDGLNRLTLGEAGVSARSELWVSRNLDAPIEEINFDQLASDERIKSTHPHPHSHPHRPQDRAREKEREREAGFAGTVLSAGAHTPTPSQPQPSPHPPTKDLPWECSLLEDE